MSHYLDKAFESFFGFVSVLPGAFSMFRWESIQGGPLESFFEGMNKESHSPAEANMYLAEDRDPRVPDQGERARHAARRPRQEGGER